MGTYKFNPPWGSSFSTVAKNSNWELVMYVQLFQSTAVLCKSPLKPQRYVNMGRDVRRVFSTGFLPKQKIRILCNEWFHIPWWSSGSSNSKSKAGVVRYMTVAGDLDLFLFSWIPCGSQTCSNLSVLLVCWQSVVWLDNAADLKSREERRCTVSYWMHRIASSVANVFLCYFLYLSSSSLYVCMKQYSYVT